MRKTALAILVLFTMFAIAPYVYAGCGACGAGEHSHEKKGIEKGGVREITYEQFQKIRNSGEKFVLLDALSKESYVKGHIEGAISFPYKTIDYNTAPALLKKSDNIIVYCGGFQCAASTKAVHRLQALGYKNVLDYKGGLEEWQKKGNKLVK